MYGSTFPSLPCFSPLLTPEIRCVWLHDLSHQGVNPTRKLKKKQVRELRVRFVYIHANCLIIGLHYHSGLGELVFHPASLSHQFRASADWHAPGLLLSPLLTEGPQSNKPLSKKVWWLQTTDLHITHFCVGEQISSTWNGKRQPPCQWVREGQEEQL